MPQTFVVEMRNKISGHRWKNQRGVPPPPSSPRIVKKKKLNPTTSGKGDASIHYQFF